jgi:hypothetical protein
VRQADKLALLIGAMNAVSYHQCDRPARYFGASQEFRMRGHPLTCGNDSNHTPLYPIFNLETGRLKLICRDCDYTQDNAGPFSSWAEVDAFERKPLTDEQNAAADELVSMITALLSGSPKATATVVLARVIATRRGSTGSGG